jgi:transcriptional regulator with PAS, ATPase and Fis domain
MSKYSWPGNVAELENAIIRALILAEDSAAIDLKDLPPIYSHITDLGEQLSVGGEEALTDTPESPASSLPAMSMEATPEQWLELLILEKFNLTKAGRHFTDLENYLDQSDEASGKKRIDGQVLRLLKSNGVLDRIADAIRKYPLNVTALARDLKSHPRSLAVALESPKIVALMQEVKVQQMAFDVVAFVCAAAEENPGARADFRLWVTSGPFAEATEI